MSDIDSLMAVGRQPCHQPVLVQKQRFTKAARFRSTRRTFYLALADMAALLFSLAVAGIVAQQLSQRLLGTSFEALESRDLAFRLLIWLALIAGVCAWFLVSGHYTTRRPLREDVPRIFSTLCMILLIDGFVQFATKSDFSRAWLVLLWVFAAAAIPLARIAVRRLLDAGGLWKLSAVIVGHGVHTDNVVEGLRDDDYLGYSFVENHNADWFPIVESAGLRDQIGDFVKQNDLDVVILVPCNEELFKSDRLIDALNILKIPYGIVPPISRLPLTGLDMQAFLSSDAVLMTVRSGLLSPLSRALKRLCDLATSIVMLIVLTPLLFLIGAIVSKDGGPILFGHERVGQGGRRFKCMKFRTMAPDASTILKNLLANDAALRQEWQTTYKLKNDPRVTPIGRFLRKTSLDELPQLLNVLMGRMSLVGPRPVVASELLDYYGADAMYYHLVKPGITGLWQISGRSDVGYARRVHLDAWYVRNWSLWTDILILLGTVPSVIRSRGAY